MPKTVPVPGTSRALLVATLLSLAAGGCDTMSPAHGAVLPETTPRTFSHAPFDSVLQRFVDDRGRVDYAGLKESKERLERYYALLGRYSPDSHPELFPTEESRLAYWINAYNASTMLAVARRYPIESVKDVKPPTLLFFLPDLAGFFVFQRMEFGEESMSLRHLENDVIRERFGEPRIHFALNCASISCPRLPDRAFTAEGLQEELERETRKFMTEERNVRIDDDEEVVYLSALFDWYREDYLDWYEREFPDREGDLLSYVALYLPPDEAARLSEVASDYEVRFNPYDWGLNDQKPGAVAIP